MQWYAIMNKYLNHAQDPRFQGGLFPIDNLDDLKVSLVIKLNDTSFSFENQVQFHHFLTVLGNILSV